MAVKIYDSNEITVIIAGIPIRGGFADGEFLRLEADADIFTDVVGTDGEVTRSKTNDARAKATLILMQSSDDNDKLSALANLDRAGKNGAGVGPFLVKDRNSRAKFEGQCWIQKEPSPSYGREATSREWVIRIPKLSRVDGGNFGV